MCAFFISTKAPALDSSPRSLPGRRYVHGPMLGRATDVGFLHAGTLHMGVGIDDRADKCCVWADLRALADHGLASRKHPGRITASRSIRTSSSIHVVSESRMVTPLRIQCSQIRLL